MRAHPDGDGKGRVRKRLGACVQPNTNKRLGVHTHVTPTQAVVVCAHHRCTFGMTISPAPAERNAFEKHEENVTAAWYSVVHVAYSGTD